MAMYTVLAEFKTQIRRFRPGYVLDAETEMEDSVLTIEEWQALGMVEPVEE